MALIAIASDKGAPGVTTAALALAAVWPRPVLLAECDPAGGDLVYRFPAAGGGHLDPRRGVLSLAVVARRGMQSQQVWEHVQKLHGGLDVLAGVTNAEQGAGLSLLWGPIGKALAGLPQADVIADCGRLGADGPLYDLLIEATTVVLVSKVHVADVIRLRDRAAAFAAAAQSRGRRGFGVGVVVVAEHKKFRAALGEVQHVLGQANAPATVLGGIAHDTKGADLLSGEWGGNLDRTMLVKTAREVAQHLAQGLPPVGDPGAAGAHASPPSGPPAAQPAPGAHAGPPSSPLHAMTPPPPAPVGRRHTAPSAPLPSTAFNGAPSPTPFPATQLTSSPPGPGGPGPMPPGPWQAGPEPSHPDLAAATLSAPAFPPPPAPVPAFPAPAPAASVPTPPAPASTPTISPDAPRTTFSRVLGNRSGRHQAAPTQAASAHAVPTQPGPAQPSPNARHAAPPGDWPGNSPGDWPGNSPGDWPGNSPAPARAPMPPLAPPIGPADLGDRPENAEDPGWGTAPWQRREPTSRPGGE